MFSLRGIEIGFVCVVLLLGSWEVMVSHVKYYLGALF